VSEAECDGDSHSIMAALANSQVSTVEVATLTYLQQDGLIESPVDEESSSRYLCWGAAMTVPVHDRSLTTNRYRKPRVTRM
jgi:hypothetical protein